MPTSATCDTLLEPVPCGAFLEAGECRGGVEAAGEMFTAAFVANGQASVAGEPAMVRSIFHRYRLSRLFRRHRVGQCAARCPLRAATGGAGRRRSPCRREAFPVCGGRTTPGLHRRDRADHRLQQRAVVSIHSGNVNAQRDSVRIGKDVDLIPSCRDRPGSARSATLFFRPHARIVQDRCRPVEFTGATGGERAADGPASDPVHRSVSADRCWSRGGQNPHWHWRLGGILDF